MCTFQRHMSVITFQIWQLYCLFNSSFNSQQIKHRCSALLALCEGMYRRLIYSLHKRTAMRKALICLDVIERGVSPHDINPKLSPYPSNEEFIRNTHYRHHTCTLRTVSINMFPYGFVIVNFTPNYSQLHSRVAANHGKLANKLNLNDRLLSGKRPIVTTHVMLCILRRRRRATPYFFRHHGISYGWLGNSSVGDSNYCYVIRRTY